MHPLGADVSQAYGAAGVGGALASIDMANTLSDLLRSGVRIWWRCDECAAAGDVDLERLIAARGPDLDLTDRHPPCRRCSYWVRFYANDGQRTWGLRTPAGDMVESRRRSVWLQSGYGKTPPTG